MSQETDLKPLSPGRGGLLSAWVRPWVFIGKLIGVAIGALAPKLAVAAVVMSPFFLVAGDLADSMVVGTTESTAEVVLLAFEAMFDLMPVVFLVLFVAIVVTTVTRGPRI